MSPRWRRSSSLRDCGERERMRGNHLARAQMLANARTRATRQNFPSRASNLVGLPSSGPPCSTQSATQLEHLVDASLRAARTSRACASCCSAARRRARCRRMRRRLRSARRTTSASRRTESVSRAGDVDDERRRRRVRQTLDRDAVRVALPDDVHVAHVDATPARRASRACAMSTSTP